MIRAQRLVTSWTRRSKLDLFLAQIFTFPARVSLSPDSPTQMLRQSFLILRSLIGFLDLSLPPSTIFLSETGPTISNCYPNMRARWLGQASSHFITEYLVSVLVSASTTSTTCSSGHLESRNALEVHHLQHLLGLGINLDDILQEEKFRTVHNLST